MSHSNQYFRIKRKTDFIHQNLIQIFCRWQNSSPKLHPSSKTQYVLDIYIIIIYFGIDIYVHKWSNWYAVCRAVKLPLHTYNNNYSSDDKISNWEKTNLRILLTCWRALFLCTVKASRNELVSQYFFKDHWMKMTFISRFVCIMFHRCTWLIAITRLN